MGRIRLGGGELRDERINILISKRVRRNLDKIATVRRTSINQIVNEAIEECLKKHEGEITRYNEFFGEEEA